MWPTAELTERNDNLQRENKNLSGEQVGRGEGGVGRGGERGGGGRREGGGRERERGRERDRGGGWERRRE